MMEQTKRRAAVEMKFGFIRGRDAIHLDRMENDGRNWTFTGEFAGAPVSANETGAEWIPYRISFRAVQSVFSHGVEHWPEWIHFDEDDSESSSFNVVENSSFLSRFPVKKASVPKHYCLKTYDVVFRILAGNFEMSTVAPTDSPDDE